MYKTLFANPVTYVLTHCQSSATKFGLFSKERNIVNPKTILFVSMWEAQSLQLSLNFTETVESLMRNFIEIVF